MKRTILFLLFLLLISCGQTVKETGERSIYSNDRLAVKGKDSGIGERYRFFYLSSFAAQPEEFDRSYRFNQVVESELEKLGARSVTKPNLAQAVITGELHTPVMSTAERATNEPGMIYRLTVVYSILDYDRHYLQKDRPVTEAVLVLNTNTVDTNEIYDKLYSLAARHTAEAVFYGWQLD